MRTNIIKLHFFHLFLRIQFYRDIFYTLPVYFFVHGLTLDSLIIIEIWKFIDKILELNLSFISETEFDISVLIRNSLISWKNSKKNAKYLLKKIWNCFFDLFHKNTLYIIILHTGLKNNHTYFFRLTNLNPFKYIIIDHNSVHFLWIHRLEC